MKKADKERIINDVVKYLWAQNGHSEGHGMPFHEAMEQDSFAYRETAEDLFKFFYKEIKKTIKKV